MARVFGPVITQPARAAHTGTVIMLHGLGDTGNGWAPVGPEMNLPHVKWVYPTAPTRPITVNGGMKMPGWFDLGSLDIQAFQRVMQGHPFDEPGVSESVRHVAALIESEVAAGIPAERIVLGGFSQGGHVALKVALTHPARLAGCVALSTWLEPSRTMKVPAPNLDVPIMAGHGSADPLIPAIIANLTLDVLRGMGIKDVSFKMYPGMQHSTCSTEMADLRAFLLKVLPDTPLTAEAVRGMSVRELKALLAGRGVSSAGLLEKADLLQAALALVPP